METKHLSSFGLSEYLWFPRNGERGYLDDVIVHGKHLNDFIGRLIKLHVAKVKLNLEKLIPEKVKYLLHRIWIQGVNTYTKN